MKRTYTARVIQEDTTSKCTATVQHQEKNLWYAFVLLPHGLYKATGKNPTEALAALADKADLSYVGKLERY